MRDFIKGVYLIVIGLIAAIVVYPFLHETGHLIFSLLCGAKPVEVSLWPLPSVLCRMPSDKVLPAVITGFGGVFTPFAATFLFRPKKFLLWYLQFVVQGICLMSFFISLLSLALFSIGKPMQNDDITQMMRIAPEYSATYLALIVAMTQLTLIRLIRSAPATICLEYFNKNKKNGAF